MLSYYSISLKDGRRPNGSSANQIECSEGGGSSHPSYHERKPLPLLTHLILDKAGTFAQNPDGLASPVWHHKV